MSELRVIVIGGPPGAGKTTLARAVAASLGFLSTTVDDLVTTARSVTDAGAHPDLHRAAGIPAVDYFTTGSPERMIADSRALENFMWPILQRLIDVHRAEKGPIVFDWWLFDPDRVVEIVDGEVASVWLHIDPDVLDRRERSLTSFRAGSSDPEQMHANFMQRSLWRNELVLERANALGLPVVHQPGDRSVDELVDEVFDVIGATPGQ